VSHSRTSTVWSGKAKKIVASPSRPATISRIPFAGSALPSVVLRVQTFIGSFMSGKNQVGVGSVQVFP